MPGPLVTAIIARLKAEVPEYGGRVEAAADLASQMRQNALPGVTPVAHVVPSGLTATGNTEVTGLFRQEVSREITVFVTLRSHDQNGRAILDEVDVLIDRTVHAVAGWAPTGDTGVFHLRRARLLSFVAGAAVYEITFALPDQLRITS